MAGEALTPERRELLRRMLQKKGVRTKAQRGIPTRDPAAAVPLTYAQEALWVVDQLQPEEALHNVPGAVRLAGQLDLPALVGSLRGIVQRHASLRTTFTIQGGLPCQIVHDEVRLDFSIVDLRGLEAAAAERCARHQATREAHRPFDLEIGPLFRAVLLHVAADEYVLLLNFHHIITDGWSMGVFTRELDHFYRALRERRTPQLPPLPIQLADFAVWQRAGRADTEEHLAYWRERLGKGLPVLELPTDRPRPQVQSFSGGHQAVRLSAALSDALRELSRREGVTLFMTLTAAFQALLHCYTRQEDIVIGSAIAHRNRKELEGLIAFLVNMVVLRTDLGGDPNFRELLGRVRQVTVDAWAHQDVPLVRLVNEVQPERDLGRTPLFQVEFSLLTPDVNPAVYGYGLGAAVTETLELPGLKVSPVEVSYDNARYDVAWFLWDMPAGISGTVEYRRDLFDAATVKRLVEHYEALLRFVVEDRGEVRLSTLVARLDRLTQQEQSARQETYASSVKQRLKGLKRRSAGRRSQAGESS